MLDKAQQGKKSDSSEIITFNQHKHEIRLAERVVKLLKTVFYTEAPRPA